MKKYRPSVFIVAYILKEKKYLLLKRKLHWVGWEFPKGGIEKNETKLETLKREINEETHLKIKAIKKFDISGKYFYEKELKDRPGFIGQTYYLYAVQLKYGEVIIDEHEHLDYSWETFEEAVKKLSWSNQRRCLAIVNNWLTKKPTSFRTFITNSGKTIYLGKDAKNNEELIKIVKPTDYVFHTLNPGSPFVKLSSDSSEEDRKIARILCAMYSHSRKDKPKEILVDSFRGEDIYKDKTMKLGTFGIKTFRVFKIKRKEIEEFKRTKEDF